MTTRLKQLAFITFLVIVCACKPEEVVPPDDPVETGESATFYILKSGVPRQGVFIGLSHTLSEQSRGEFFRISTSDFNGRAKFQPLEPDTIYYEASFLEGGTPHERTGAFPLYAGEDKEIYVQF